MDRLEMDVNNHHKHYHGLILWLQNHKGHVLIDQENLDCEEPTIINGNKFDLCHMLSEGSTVATCIWDRYKGGWSPKNKEQKIQSAIANQQTKVRIIELISELEDLVSLGATCHSITTRLKRAAQEL